jgi:hypothetical protein
VASSGNQMLVHALLQAVLVGVSAVRSYRVLPAAFVRTVTD